MAFLLSPSACTVSLFWAMLSVYILLLNSRMTAASEWIYTCMNEFSEQHAKYWCKYNNPKNLRRGLSSKIHKELWFVDELQRNRNVLRRPYVWCIPTQCLLLATIPMWQPHTSHHGPSGRWEGLSIIWIEPRPKDVLSRESSRRQRVLDREQYESPYRSGAGTYKHCTWTSIRDSFL